VIKHVFVYGTLKPGLRFHHLCQDIGLLSVEKAFVQGYDLFHISPENYPAILTGSGTVYGYLLEFEDIVEALAVLDELEGVNTTPAHYFRKKAIAKPHNTEAWIYVYNAAGDDNLDRLEPVVTGIWQPKEI